MNSNCIFLQLTVAFFAFATGYVPKPDSTPEKDASDDLSLATLYETGYSEACEFSKYWTVPLEKEVTLVYYTREYPEGNVFDFESQPIADIHDSTETKILTHGFKGNLNSTEFRAVIAAYLKRNDKKNLLALDWSSYTSDKYRDAAKAAITIGKAFSYIFCVLYRYYDIYPYQLHFIGHNLGAHLLAAAARESGNRIKRITGLDPARLCFEDHCKNFYYPQLTKNDANFVDILHTDAGNSGILHPEGMADFYGNIGMNQPMCHTPHTAIPVQENCESLASYLYFAESISIPESFYGVQCKSVYPMLTCNSTQGYYWGEYMENTPRGIFNFYTRGKSPFGEGKRQIPNY